MDNGIYITLSRQMALFRDMEVTANNISNANTTGYGSEHILFNSYLTKDVNQRVRNDMAFAYDISTYNNLETGAIQATGNQLDFAIDGNGFFAVETPLGVRYTRAGNFTINSLGTLVTASGDPVLGNNGQYITFPPEVQDIKVGENGVVSVDGEEFGSIDVYAFSNPQLLEKLDGAMFRSEIAPEEASDFRLMQGALASSNVKPVLELTHMIEVSRSVASTAKLIETMYELQRKSANTWAQQSS